MLDVTLPQLGESVSEGTVSKWLVTEGDVVQKDDLLLEISRSTCYRYVSRKETDT